MNYHAYGINVDCALELPAPPAAALRAPDLSIRQRPVDIEGIRFAPLEGIDEDTEVWLDRAWDEERIVLRFPDMVAELRDGHIWIDPLEVEDLDYLAHVILDHVIPRWLALQGDIVLHGGSAIMPSGLAVAFIGESGTGKSSITTALGRHGWPVLGDDAARLVRSGDGWLAFPAYPGSRLLGDSRRALTPETRSAPMTGGADKHRLVADVPVATDAAQLGLIVELGDDRVLPATARLSLPAATAGLVRHSFYLAPTLGEVAPRAFVQSSELAEAVPCVRLDFPRRWDIYPDLMRMIEELDIRAVP